LDLTRLLPGPFCTQILADLGADVIKVESLEEGDYLRATPPFTTLPDRDTPVSAYFAAINRGKRSLALNLKSPAGCEVFLRLAAGADLVIESFRPGTVDRMGIGYQAVKAVRPDIIYCSLSGYGQTGSRAADAGHDLNYLALAGYLSLLPPDSRLPPPVQLADLGGALMAVIAILAALHGRKTKDRRREAEDGGQRLGAYLDIALIDAVRLMLSPFIVPHWRATGAVPTPQTFPLGGALPCYRVYRTADDRAMALGALEAKFWQAFCLRVDRPDLLERQFDTSPEAHAALETLFASYSRDEWVQRLAGVDCCCTPVLDLEEAAAVTPVPLWAGGPLADDSPPGLGEQTRIILGEAGYAPAEIEHLIAQGVVK